MVNMIAAGEVIERPASVVKELMENSIDSEATSIKIVIEDGGRKLISVTDNGCGMDAEDLAVAFEPHATSKIKNSDDLRRINTLGFRGEALASIASVALVRAVSRAEGSAEAYRIEIDCGRKSQVAPCSADYGTTIEVRDLFYKLPARRRFLKTANTEMTHITEQFTRIALANNTVGMTLVHNGREIYRLSAHQTVRQRIAELISNEIADNLIETELDEKNIHIFALLGRAEIARTNNKLQYVFINGRFVRDKFVSHAIKEAYRGVIEPDRFPVVFLFIQMPPEEVDVNVHPTKIEVRFYNPNLVHSQVLGCLRTKLLGTGWEAPAKLPASVTGRSTTKTPTGGPRSREIAEAMAEFFKRHRPAQTQRHFDYSTAGPVQSRPEPIPKEQTRAVQIHDSYIVAQVEDGFIVIDQHALHERIMYEALSSRIRQHKLESQRLLIPESLEVTDAQLDALEANREFVERLGIELSPFGPKLLAVQAFPVILANVAPGDFVSDLLDLLADRELTRDADKLLNEVLNMAACKAAIKAGQKLTDSEIEQLLADREKLQHPARCPHGRPTAIKFTMAELEKQFKRT